MARRITAESSLLKACTDLLSAERIWWMRINTVGDRIVNYRTKSGEDRTGCIKGQRPGTGDIFSTPWIPSAQMLMMLWLELKSASGRQAEKQKEFQSEVEAAGHTYLLIRDVDELRNWLVEHGAIGDIR